MDVINAFLLATAFAYLACFVYTIMGKPPLIGVSNGVQAAFYGLAFVVFIFVSTRPSVTWLNFLLGVAYSFACVASFIGWPQRWAAYWKENPEEGSDAAQIEMALWDLALAVAFFSL